MNAFFSFIVPPVQAPRVAGSGKSVPEFARPYAPREERLAKSARDIPQSPGAGLADDLFPQFQNYNQCWT